MADNPIYQEARKRGGKIIRDMHKPPEGGDKCESGVARGMIEGYTAEEEETSDIEMDIEKQEGKREVEKFVHGHRNGEIIGGPAGERRMRHATREENRPSFWTYLKANGCRGCQRLEEEESIHHVLSGGGEGINRNKNNKYRMEIIKVLGRCRKLMSGVNNNEGVEQADKALRALEKPRRLMDPSNREEEELALRQIISGIIPELQETDNKKKKGVIARIRIWTGEMMNNARIQINTWIKIENEHKAKVQYRWDNRTKTKKAFQIWRKKVGHEWEAQKSGKEEGVKERERTYGIKNWGRVRPIPKIHIQDPPEAYILTRGVHTLPYLVIVTW
eukprot:2100156-Pleurochrysis_carterae.AAC.1